MISCVGIGFFQPNLGLFSAFSYDYRSLSWFGSRPREGRHRIFRGNDRLWRMGGNIAFRD
jgi:hypothetical protein